MSSAGTVGGNPYDVDDMARPARGARGAGIGYGPTETGAGHGAKVKHGNLNPIWSAVEVFWRGDGVVPRAGQISAAWAIVNTAKAKAHRTQNSRFMRPGAHPLGRNAPAKTTEWVSETVLQQDTSHPLSLLVWNQDDVVPHKIGWKQILVAMFRGVKFRMMVVTSLVTKNSKV